MLRLFRPSWEANSTSASREFLFVLNHKKLPLNQNHHLDETIEYNHTLFSLLPSLTIESLIVT